MNDRVVDESLGFVRSYWFREGNSNAKKLAMLLALVLFLAMSVGIVFFGLQLDQRGDALWTLLLTTFAYLLGRNHEGEVRHRRKRRGIDDE